MGAVDTTYTFTATDTITSSKMNNIIDQTTITGDAIFGTTLEVASGKLKIRSQGITSNELAANAVTSTQITDLNVTTIKIADLNVTTAKISDLGITTAKIADLGVTTAKIADASVAPIKLAQPLTRSTSQNASGTAIDFVGIPSWVKKITVIVSGISTNGSSIPQIQLGTSSGIVTTGYLGSGVGIASGTAATAMSSGFLTQSGGAATTIRHGIATICNISGNIWVCNGVFGISNIADSSIFGGTVSLSGVLDRIRFAAVNNTDAFDAGSINIMYE